MNILDAIQARQSIRSFKNKEVSKEIISLAKEGSLIGEISRNKLNYELNNLSNKLSGVIKIYDIIN